MFHVSLKEYTYVFSRAQDRVSDHFREELCILKAEKLADFSILSIYCNKISEDVNGCTVFLFTPRTTTGICCVCLYSLVYFWLH